MSGGLARVFLSLQNSFKIDFFEQNGLIGALQMAVHSPSSLSAPPVDSVKPLTELETQAIDLFIGFVGLFGLPKSIGELYGLLFFTSQPLAMDDLMQRLNMSKGAASQGLKLLRAFGAIKTVYVPGSRRDYYLAEVELSRFAAGFIKEELQPHLDHGLLRLQRMESLISELPATDQSGAINRLSRLRHWHEKSQDLIPWILKSLSRKFVSPF
jgi:DNA-binding transcriptional regulator GbsR (MarR family)